MRDLKSIDEWAIKHAPPTCAFESHIDIRSRGAALANEWARDIVPCELKAGEKYFENDPTSSHGTDPEHARYLLENDPDLEETYDPDEPDRINKDNFTLAGRAEVRLNITLIR